MDTIAISVFGPGNQIATHCIGQNIDLVAVATGWLTSKEPSPGVVVIKDLAELTADNYGLMYEGDRLNVYSLAHKNMSGWVSTWTEITTHLHGYFETRPLLTPCSAPATIAALRDELTQANNIISGLTLDLIDARNRADITSDSSSDSDDSSSDSDDSTYTDDGYDSELSDEEDAPAESVADVPPPAICPRYRLFDEPCINLPPISDEYLYRWHDDPVPDAPRIYTLPATIVSPVYTQAVELIKKFDMSTLLTRAQRDKLLGAQVAPHQVKKLPPPWLVLKSADRIYSV